jgi:hypothetical protein
MHSVFSHVIYARFGLVTERLIVLEALTPINELKFCLTNCRIKLAMKANVSENFSASIIRISVLIHLSFLL